MSTPSKKTKRTASSNVEVGEEENKHPKTVISSGIFHADTVGSYLRPDSLLAAREKKVKGEISAADLEKLEDEAIKALVLKQVEAGLKIVTDGELRRESYWLDFWTGFDNVVESDEYRKRAFSVQYADDKNETADNSNERKYSFLTPLAVGKISPNPNHKEFRGFEYLKSVTPDGIVPKVIIPSPNFLLIFRIPGDLFPQPYKTQDEFFDDIRTAYKEAILGFYQRGARYIQIDEPTWLIWPFTHGKTREEQFELLHKYVDWSVKILKPILESLPKDLNIIIHTCRANGSTHFEVPYSYADILPGFAELQPSYLLLEYDDERSGSFEILKEYAAKLPNTRFFLGVVTTKNTTVEEAGAMEARIRDAAKFAPLSSLGISTQCGFGTFKEGNPTNETAQWGKVQLLGSLAKKIWDD